jgi:hypothetical protein
MLAMRNGTPFIALDQIAGGAKVSRLLGQLGWPYVYQVDTTDLPTMISAIDALLEDSRLGLLEEAHRRARLRAHYTLNTLENLLSLMER